MGSGGKKRSRKGKPVQHLPKVGSEEDIRRSQRAERDYVMRDVGVPVDRLERSKGGKVFLVIAGVVVVALVLGGLAVFLVIR